MKRRQTVAYGIFAVVLALAFTACPGTNQPEPDTGSVAGTAVFPGGEGGIAITLMLEAAHGQFSSYVVVTDETGDGVSFRFDDVPPGNHALYASWQGAPGRGHVRNVEVRAGIVYPLGNINITLIGCSCTHGNIGCGCGAIPDACGCGTIPDACGCGEVPGACNCTHGNVGCGCGTIPDACECSAIPDACGCGAIPDACNCTHGDVGCNCTHGNVGCNCAPDNVSCVCTPGTAVCDCAQPAEAITIVSNGTGVTALGVAPGHSRILYARCPDGNALYNVLWFSTNPNVVSVQRPAGRSMMESGESVQIIAAAGAEPGQTATIRATSMAGGDRLVEAALVVTIAAAETLAEQLARLRQYAQDGGRYFVDISGDEGISPAEAALPTGRTDIVITLRGNMQMRYVLLGATGNLFTIGSGVTLVLDENITLMGRGPNASPPTGSNNTQLVRVNSGGTLVMNEGARITGNTVSGPPSAADDAGGVRINTGGRFVMHGGEISHNNFNADFNHGGGVDVFGGTFEMRDGRIFGNNTVSSAGGGGVRVHSGGVFHMSGGVIYGSDSPAGFPNTTSGSATGTGSSLSTDATAQHGTFDNGTFNRVGDLGTESRTIEVRNGALIRPGVAPPPPPIGFVRVDGGTFQMGSCPIFPVTPIRSVTLSGFYMSRFQITQGEWYDVMGTWPSLFTGTNAFDSIWNMITVTPAFDRRNLPVEQVSWYDAIVFSNRLSIQRGLTPAYSIGGSTNPDDWGPVPTGINDTWNAVVMVPGSTGYRLPTEAQWEFAARGGIVCQGSFAFSGSNTAANVAWYRENSGGRTHEVGTRQPNALGLYDMSGNVFELVWDWSGTYPSFSETDPVGASSGFNRVIRGGGWVNAAANARSADRNSIAPPSRHENIGFRLVRP